MIRVANDAGHFGLVSRLLHWLMAAGILVMLGLGTWIMRMEVNLSNLWLFGVHKTIGFSLLVLAAIRIAWHRASPPPRPIGDPDDWRSRAARLAHLALYVLMLAVPITGWVASSATGLDVMVFDTWALPPLAPVSETWEKTFFAVHGILTKLLAALLVLHVAGAFSRRDGTLRRMLRGQA